MHSLTGQRQIQGLESRNKNREENGGGLGKGLIKINMETMLSMSHDPSGKAQVTCKVPEDNYLH